jgi:hypothetical protein
MKTYVKSLVHPRPDGSFNAVNSDFFYCFIIHMCIQCLGHFSPLPPPLPYHLLSPFPLPHTDIDAIINLLNSEAMSLRAPGISFLLADLEKNNLNHNNDYCLLSD